MQEEIEKKLLKKKISEKKLPKKKTSFLFKIIKILVRLFYGKMEVVGLEKLPQENAILVGNHCQMNGPIAGELFLPDNCYTWCAGQMMKLKDVPAYAFDDFWSKKPKWQQPFFRAASYLIAPLAVVLFNNARTVAVYRDMRIMSTFKESLKMLQQGINLLIFPEKDETYNNILYRFQENFIDIAAMYYKKTGISLSFVPVYIAPTLRKIYIGNAVLYNSENKISEERERISAVLAEEITNMARKLPEHIVVPYRNVPKKNYLTNKQVGEVPHEKTGC